MSPRNDDVGHEYADIAKSIRALMQRKGITKRGQTKKLKEILGLSLSQSHRKMNGTSAWELPQIRQVAEYFKEPFDSLSTLFAADTSVSDEPLMPGILKVSDKELPCKVLTGSPLHTTKNVDYIASQNELGQWIVADSTTAIAGGKYFKVKKLELVIHQARQLSIAVLDDNELSADNLCEYLIETGFHAEAFYDIDTLWQDISEGNENVFDAFVIDWIIAGKTSESLIQLIRSKLSPAVPIYLLTGEIVTGRAQESEVARIIVDYNVHLYEKPTRLPIIAAGLSKTLGVL